DAVGVTITTGNTINFPVSISVGNYYLNIIWHGSVAAVVTYPVLTFTNCAVLTSYAQGTTTSQTGVVEGADAGATINNCSLSTVFSVNAPGATQATIAFGAGGTLPSGTVSCIFVLAQVNPSSL